MTNILPDHPGDLLDAALDDALILSRNKDYILDRETYHAPTDGGCAVCLAGAIMSTRLSVDINSCRVPRDYDLDTACKLRALNEFVFLDVKEGLHKLNIPITPKIKKFCSDFEWEANSVWRFDKYFLVNEKIFRKLANELRRIIPKKEEKCQKEQVTKQKQEQPRLKLVG